jgi:hypothetical protein
VSYPNISLCLTFHRAYAKLRLQLDEELGHGGVTDRRIALRPAGRSLIKTAHDTVGGACANLSFNEDAKRLNGALLKFEHVHRS